MALHRRPPPDRPQGGAGRPDRPGSHRGDRAGLSEADARFVDAIRAEDRRFVAGLPETQPGPQVRSAAAWAVRPEATDADLVEFFAFAWASAAAADMVAYRTRCANDDAVWRASLRRLMADAEAAEKAAREAAGEAANQARDVAARAWRSVGERTGPASVAWADAQRVAEAQAAAWQRVSQAAGAAAGPNWTAIAGTALSTADQWAAQQRIAAEQAAFWTRLNQQALAAELALRTPPAG